MCENSGENPALAQSLKKYSAAKELRIAHFFNCYLQLLYHQPTFNDNKFHQPRRNKLQEVSRCRKQIPCIVTSSRRLLDLNQNVNRHCHVAVRSKTSFLPCKEEDTLLHTRKINKSSHNACKHYRMFDLLSFSFCQMFTSVTKHFPTTSIFSTLIEFN